MADREGADMDERTGVLTVRAFLDEELAPGRRTHHLDALCARVAGQPLDSTVASLREVVAGRIGLEDYRRLHVLISHLYHACGASIPLTTELRAEVAAAVMRHETAAPLEDRREVIRMSCPNENCRKGGCTTDPQPQESGHGRRG